MISYRRAASAKRAPSPLTGEGRGEGDARLRYGLSVLAIVCLTLLAPGCSKVAGQSAAGMSAMLPSPLTGEGKGEGSAQIPHIQILPLVNATGDLPLQVIDLGTVRQGEVLRCTIIVENRTTDSVTIDRLTTSCECGALNGAPITISAAGEAELHFSLDTGKYPDFYGELGVDSFAFFGPSHVLQFKACANVTHRNGAR